MSKFIKIRSKGLAPVEAFHLIGASSKREDDTQIGMFGSGAKYALAYLLRNAIGVRIFIGTKEITIATEPVTMRGKTYQRIVIDGHATSITTDLGPKWSAEGAFRELYTNALDEGEHFLNLSSSPSGSDGDTTIFIEANDEMKDVYERRQDLFSEFRKDKPLFKMADGAAIYHRSHPNDSVIYRRGVKVWRGSSVMMIPYDVELPDVDVNEERSISDPWQGYSEAWQLMLRCDDVRLVERFARNMPNDSPYLFSSALSAVWREYIADKVVYQKAEKDFLSAAELRNSVRVPSSFVEMIERDDVPCKRPSFILNKTGYTEKSLSALQSRMIAASCRVLSENGIEIDRNTVALGDMYKEGILGMVCNKTNRIILSDNAFTHGQSSLTGTLLEEYLHIKSGEADCTRGFQEALLGLCVTLMELHG